MGLGDDSIKKSYYPTLQRKLKEFETLAANLETLFQSAKDAIIVHTREGKIIQMNQEALKLLNIQEQEIEGYSIYSFSPKYLNRATLDLNWKDAEAGIPRSFDWHVQQKHSEQIIPVNISVNKSTWNNQEVILSILRDQTERKRYEQQLIEAKEKAEESDRLKTVLLNNISHELRTPMNGILGFIKLMDSPGIEPQKQQKFLHIIHQSTIKLLKVLEDLLDISLLKSSHIKTAKEIVSLDKVLDELYSRYYPDAQKNNTKLILKKLLQENNSYIYTDGEKMSKILSHLLRNAIEHTHNGTVTIRCSQKNNQLELQVVDTGNGIPPAEQEKIFEVFQQSKDISKTTLSGLGLGLSIASENAKLLNGSLKLQSELHQGSCFTLTIPYVSNESQPEA